MRTRMGTPATTVRATDSRRGIARITRRLFSALTRLNKIGLRQFAREALRQASVSLVARKIDLEPRAGLQRFGSSYGGWWVPTTLLSADSICYLAGVGEDTTFDLALIEQFGCLVVGIDPTPRAIAHVAQFTNRQFEFVPVGLWKRDEVLTFFEPTDPAHVSHSVIDSQRTSKGFTAECVTIKTLMDRLGHDHIDLLKLDIEGAEVAVIESLIATGIRPSVLCVELDAFETPWRTLARLRKLVAAGYQCCYRDGRNYTFALLPASVPNA